MTTRSSPTQTVTLSNGVEMPTVGLGVFRARRGDEARAAVREALALGYRHIDTAAVYGNETDVGAAVRESGVPREQVFVTTKLWNSDQGYDNALRAFDVSQQRLGLDRVDLYLLHWPVHGLRLESWRALERLYEEGRVRAIGVSNFMTPHLDELLKSCHVAPMVDQVEASPFLQQRSLRELCSGRGIVVEAYSPLTKGLRLGHATVRSVAEALGKTPAQILIRWAIERGMVPLPKSVTPARMAENFAVYDWSLGEAALAALDALEEGLVTGWDPRSAP